MKRLVSCAVMATLLLAACGSDDSASNEPGPDTEAPTNDGAGAASSSATGVDGKPAGTQATDDAPEADGDRVHADAFPVTIDHKFGSTTIAAEPIRVVSVGFNEHDFLLALGVVPVGLREWYGDQPNGVWPWAQDELGNAEPAVIAPDAINFEQIAALDPDLIVGVWSGMTAEDYDLLAAIAPTVAQPDTYDDYGTPWQEQTQILGRATGRVDEAAAVVAELESRFASIREEHPEWVGKEASVAFVTEDGPGAYTSQDTRSRIMIDLGFDIPEVNDSIDDGAFYLELSPEDLSPLDVDVLIWVAGSQEGIDRILNELPTRPPLAVVQQGREIFASIELGGAFSHGSPLSIGFALDQLVPEIESAVDGDPTTAVPSAVEVGAAEGTDADPAPATETPDDATHDTAAQFSPEQEAAADAWASVFDSTVGFDAKATSLADASSLQSTIESYTAAGESFGGISLVPTAVTIDGDLAEVTYDVNFGGNPAYSDQTGTIERIDGVWRVSRDEFCAFMLSARVTCES